MAPALAVKRQRQPLECRRRPATAHRRLHNVPATTSVAAEGMSRLFGTRESHSRWPDDGERLVALLRANPGRIALVSGVDADVQQLVSAFSDVLGADAMSVSRVFSERLPQTPDAVNAALLGRPLLADLDILFWKPWLSLDPVRILEQQARRSPVVAVWPGMVIGGTATYSAPGRSDYYTSRLADAVVLRARARRYPDEVPYTTEWISG